MTWRVNDPESEPANERKHATRVRRGVPRISTNDAIRVRIASVLWRMLSSEEVPTTQAIADKLQMPIEATEAILEKMACDGALKRIQAREQGGSDRWLLVFGVRPEGDREG